jgi:hypothetical protein
LKCSLIDRVTDPFIRHAITPRYIYARPNACGPAPPPQIGPGIMPAIII